MSSKRKEDWISIYTPEGERKIASPSYIKKLLGLNLFNICNRLIRMESQIDKLESPQRQAQIFELLDIHGKHNWVWIFNRVENVQRSDIKELVDTGLIVESKSGSRTMYSCAVKA